MEELNKNDKIKVKWSSLEEYLGNYGEVNDHYLVTYSVSFISA